jgi:hypothetical protein
VQDECGLPRSGGLTEQVSQTRDCVRSAYEGQRARWLSRLGRNGAVSRSAATKPSQRNRWFADSPLEESGFELLVPP